MELIPVNEIDDVLGNVLVMLNTMLYGLSVDKVFKVIQGDEEKYLIIDDNTYFIVNMDNYCFSSLDIFETDENGNINFLLFHNTNAVFDGDGAYMIGGKDFYEPYQMGGDLEDLLVACSYDEEDEGYPITNELDIRRIKDVSTNYSSYNAAICYTESNYETMVRVHSFNYFNAKFDGSDRISEGFLNEPYEVKLVSIAHTSDTSNDREYFLTSWDRGYEYYNLALYKTVGLFDFLFKRFKGSFEFYYNKRIVDGDNKVNLYNLITSGMFDLGDITKKVAQRGLSMKVPQLLIDYFNKEHENFKYCEKLLELVNSNSIRLLRKKSG